MQKRPGPDLGQHALVRRLGGLMCEDEVSLDARSQVLRHEHRRADNKAINDHHFAGLGRANDAADQHRDFKTAEGLEDRQWIVLVA